VLEISRRAINFYDASGVRRAGRRECDDIDGLAISQARYRSSPT
jgi:hypothetical protein